MDVFDITAGVAGGILLASCLIFSMVQLSKHEQTGTDKLWHYIGILFPIAMIAASYYLAM